MDQFVATIDQILQLRVMPGDGLGVGFDREAKAEPGLVDRVRRRVALVLKQDRARQLARQVAHRLLPDRFRMLGEALCELARRRVKAGMRREELQRVFDLLKDDEIAADPPQHLVGSRRSSRRWLCDFLSHAFALPLSRCHRWLAAGGALNGLTPGLRPALACAGFWGEPSGSTFSIRANTEFVGECRDRRHAAEL